MYIINIYTYVHPHPLHPSPRPKSTTKSSVTKRHLRGEAPHVSQVFHLLHRVTGKAAEAFILAARTRQEWIF